MAQRLDTMRGSEGAVAIWIALIAGLSAVFSLSFACATPLAALAAASASELRRRDALLLVALAWLINQAIGYGVLHYPRTPDSFGWGLAIGLAALAATAAGLSLRSRQPAGAALWVAAFAAAFAVYEGVLFAATAVLPSSAEAFSAAVVGRILLTNLVALIGLAVLHRAATMLKLLPGPFAPARA